MYNTKMSVLTGLSWLLTCASLICVCNCQDSLVSVIRNLNQFEKDLLDNKADVLRVEKRVLSIIDVAKVSLKSELKESIRDQVREAMADILQEDSLQDMVKGEIVSEVRQLKHEYRQMRRQFHHVSRSFNEFPNKTGVFHKTLLKKVDIGNKEDSRDECVRDKHKLELELQQCNVYIADLKADNERFEKFNQTNQSQKSQLKTTVAVISSSQAPQHLNSTSRSTGSTSVTRTEPSMTTPKPHVLTTSVKTPRPSMLSATTLRSQDERRILIAPLESSTKHPFRQLSIPSNNLSVYKYHAMNWVTTLAYIAKTNKLLIGLYNPNKILSSTFDTSNVTVLMEGVYATGMAVDESRDIIFMSTYRPRYSISRMSTQGEDFTNIVDLFGYGGIPRQITVDTRRKRIFSCNEDKLFTVTYDGHGPTILTTGTAIFALTLDATAGVVYYNDDKKLMKMTVYNNVRSQVTTLNTLPWNMKLYRGTISLSHRPCTTLFSLLPALSAMLKP